MSSIPPAAPPSVYYSPRFQRIPGILIFVIPLIGFILLLVTSPDFSNPVEALLAWGLWLGLFTLASLSDDSEGHELWYSYRNLAIMTCWLSQGLVAALALLVVGCIVTVVMRLRSNGRDNLRLPLNALLLSFIPLAAAALIYGLLGGQLPLQHVSPSEALPLIAALLTNFAVLQVIRFVVVARLRKLSYPAFASPEDRTRLATESALALLTVGLPLIYSDSGAGVFIIIQAMIVGYAIRYHETADLAAAGRDAFEQSATLLQKLGLVSQAVQSFVFNIDRRDTLKSTCEAAIKLTEADGAAVFLVDAETDTPKLGISIGLDAAHEMVLDQMRYRHNQPFVVEDTSGSPLVNGSTIRAFVQIPLGSEHVPIGFLVAYHRQPHHYKTNEVELLGILGSQLAAAMDNAHLIAAMEFHTFEMTHLVHLSRISASSLDIDAVAAEISLTLHRMTAASSVTIALLENDMNRLHLLGTIDENATDGVDTPTYLLPQFPEVQALRTQSAPTMVVYHIGDSSNSKQLKSFMERDDLTTMMIVPLSAYQSIFGVIFLGAAASWKPTRHETDLIEAAAKQIATQLYNLRVHRETSQALERQLKQLALIEDIVQQISTTHNFNVLISHVFEAAIQSTQADMVALALLTDADDYWVIEQHYETEGVSRRVSAQMKDQGIIGQVGRTGEIVIAPDNSSIPAYLPPEHETYISSMAVPLEQNGAVVGVLNVESKRKRFFTMSQANFLKNLGAHALISIENNRLLNELHFQIETLTSLREFSLALSSAVDTDSVADAVLQASIRMLGGQCAGLFRYDPLDGELRLIAHNEPGERLLTEDQLPLTIVREAATTGQIQMVDDVAVNGHKDSRLASLIAAPMIREGQVHEVLCVGYSERQQFESRDLNTVSLLAGQAAGHLENAALHKQIWDGNNRMKAILDSTRDGIILLDNQGRLAEVNPAAQHLMGIPLSEHVDEPFVDVLLHHTESDDTSPAGYSREELIKLARIQRLEPEGPTRREFSRKVLPNQTLFIQESGSPVLDEDQQNVGRLLVLRDITDEKLVESYRDEITGMAVHDLRSPLASIIDALRIALDSLENPGGAAVATQTINLALVSADKLMGLVNSLMELRKTRKMELALGPVGIGELIEAAQQMLAPSAEKAQIPVEIQIPPDLPPVNVDADKIRRVLINLLDNAIRYTPSGKPIQIRVIPEYTGHKLLVQVSDSGPGIPAKERDRIFEQFWQVKENRPLRGTKGHGIGLTFCQRVLEAHGEHIWVEESGPLPGACFAFTLPLNHQEARV
jgi:PAS domain S-box-containing protein